MSAPSAPDTDVRSRRETRENRGRGRGRGGRKFFKTSHDADKTNLVHNVPFLKHGGSINACMLWNLRVADYAVFVIYDILYLCDMICVHYYRLIC